MLRLKHRSGLQFACITVGVLAFALAQTRAYASNFVEVDLSSVVNAQFQYLNPGFYPIIGNTTGNQGTGIPFLVAGAPGTNNYWLGSGQSVTVPVGLNAATVYTLTDNIWGTEGLDEYNMTFTSTTGATITEQYIGGQNTKDYNGYNCSTTGCDVTPGAAYWYIQPSTQFGLQVVAWTLPANFGTLASVTITQMPTPTHSNGLGDLAIFAGLTVTPSSATPEPASVLLLVSGLAGIGTKLRRSMRP